MRPDKILYFIEGPLPTSEDYAKALELRANVMFRNAQAVPVDSSSALEECDGVAGEVPPSYAAKYPPAEAAIAKTKAQLKALQQKAGERAPKPGTLPTRPEAGTLPTDPETDEEDSEGRARKDPESAHRDRRPPQPTQLPAEPPKAATKPADKGWAPNK